MKRYFLLGGYDLEMLTIKELLEESGEQYFDRKLTWDNARLEMYKDVLDKFGYGDNTFIYGIELRSDKQDIINYPNYVSIDHHNELNRNPASLIQVAGILDKPLNRFQQLIAANDSGYIPAMVQLGATKEEIEKVRYLDRQAQGVTKNDERLAEDAIVHHLIRYNNLTVVKSETSRFSAICDRLYPFKSLLIYNDNEWMFYGEGVEKVILLFRNKPEVGKFFYGGRENGFAGVASGYSQTRINDMKEIIIKTITNNQ